MREGFFACRASPALQRRLPPGGLETTPFSSRPRGARATQGAETSREGARHLRSVDYDERVTNLVAHHSCAAVEAELRDVSGALADFD